MMSSATAQRAGRAPKDKVKPQQPYSATKVSSEVTKPPESIVSKIQPTAEQLRIAQIVNDAHKVAYPDLKDKVERIIEITGGSSDAALVALHDCDNDTNRAAIMLLEGNQEEGKWETSSKKKKNRQPPKAAEVNGHEPPSVEKEEKEPVENATRRREQKPRDGGYRYRGPPRMNRGNQGRNWRNKENEKNERNLQDDSKRYRNFEGRSRGPRRGRGRGGRSRTFQNRGLQNDGFPESIDTWTNSTAERVNNSNTGDGAMTVGNWSDIAVNEEWSEEDWTEALTETKVFTPSVGTQSSAAVLDMPSSTALAQNLDLASFLQKASSNSESGTPQTLNGISQQGSSSLMSQQMTSQIPQSVVPQSQAHFDFNQAAESIKAAVGVVTAQNSSTPSINANSSFQSSSGNYQSNYSSVNSGNSQHHVNLSHDLQQVIVSQPGFSSGSTGVQGVHMPRDMRSAVISQSPSISSVKTTATSSLQPLPPRSKPPKARLPPPSKIPESAVVMPDDAVTSLDVQFGALQFGTDSSPFDFTSENSTPYQEISQSSNVPSHATNQSISSSITSHTLSSALPSSVSLTKDSTYSIGSHSTTNQNSITSDLSQSQKVSTQDSILLSQGEHKAVDSVSSYVNHRSNQSSALDGSMMSSKPHQPSAMSSYSSSSHDNSSAYSTNPYASQKSVLNTSSLVPSTVGYTHASSSLNSMSNDLASSQQQSKYQSQVTQSQNSSYVTGSSMQSSPYAMQSTAYSGSSTTSGSTYPSQTGYSSHATGNYGSNSSGYGSQQSVYGSAVATTTQSGNLLSTSVSASKLTNSLAHVVKDSGLLESQHTTSQHTYDVPSTTSSSSVLSANSLVSTTATNHSTQNSTNMNSVLGLVSTSSSTTTTSVLKNSLSATGKTVPNIPQNVPVLGHQYIMGQASLPFYGLQQPVYSYEDMQMLQSKLSTLGLQSPVYSYEDMQMLQSKLSTLGYYDMQFQAPTSMTGRDPGMGSVAYTVADGKYSRADTDASSVATTLSQGQANTQAHGQAFLNPAAALPPGYGYYFAGGMMTGGIHHYAPPIFPVPSATNTHGATTSTQFQKTGYGSHSYANSGYESLTQAQDYSKGTYGATSQNQVKGVSGSGAVSDLSGSVYSKTLAHAKSYEKPGFHTGTPPPFNLAGSQATGALGASSGPYATQFIPVLAHGQHHSTALLHHHMQQDTTQAGGTPTAGQRGPQGLGQQKNSTKQSYPYWTNN